MEAAGRMLALQVQWNRWVLNMSTKMFKYPLSNLNPWPFALLKHLHWLCHKQNNLHLLQIVLSVLQNLFHTVIKDASEFMKMPWSMFNWHYFYKSHLLAPDIEFVMEVDIKNAKRCSILVMFYVLIQLSLKFYGYSPKCTQVTIHYLSPTLRK